MEVLNDLNERRQYEGTVRETVSRIYSQGVFLSAACLDPSPLCFPQQSLSVDHAFGKGVGILTFPGKANVQQLHYEAMQRLDFLSRKDGSISEVGSSQELGTRSVREEFQFFSLCRR